MVSEEIKSKLLPAKKARKIVESVLEKEKKYTFFEKIIDEINDRISQQLFHLTIEQGYSYSETQMFELIDNDIDGIKTFLLENGYQVKKFMKKQYDIKETNIAGFYSRSAEVIGESPAYEIHWSEK